MGSSARSKGRSLQKGKSAADCPQPTERLGSHLFRPQERSAHTTSQGHPRAAFRRAIERGNLVSAELEAREAGRLDLGEALELTALVALRDRPRSRRLAARWLRRWLEERPAPLIDEAVMVAGSLAALGGPLHTEALAALRQLQASEAPGRRLAPFG
jgi:hypothetical protein